VSFRSDAAVLLVDKSFVGVECARSNAALNGIANAGVLLSNGYAISSPTGASACRLEHPRALATRCWR
jgi:16S rRNA G1207 methylase RsmC